MEHSCDIIIKCDFYKKYKERTSKFWTNLLDTYCEGFLYQKCERRLFRLETGENPPDHMMPTGELPELFLKLP